MDTDICIIIIAICSYIHRIQVNLIETMKLTICNTNTPKTPKYIFRHPTFSKLHTFQKLDIHSNNRFPHICMAMLETIVVRFCLNCFQTLLEARTMKQECRKTKTIYLHVGQWPGEFVGRMRVDQPPKFAICCFNFVLLPQKYLD